MANESESRRGYGYKVHKRDNFRCNYCGYDGRSFNNWLQLSVDRIRPGQQGGWYNLDNLVTACLACNSITSRMKFPKGISKKEIIKRKRMRVAERRKEFYDFWRENVAGKKPRIKTSEIREK